MNLTLSNPAFLGVVGRDSDVTSYVARVAAVGGVVDSRTADLVTAFVAGLKSDGLWTKISEIGLFAGVGSLASALVKLKYPIGAASTLTNHGFVAADYVPFGITCGLQNMDAPPDGLTPKYLDTGTPNSLVNIGSNFLCVNVTEYSEPFNYSEFFFGRLGDTPIVLGIETLHPSGGPRATGFGGDVGNPATASNSEAKGNYILSRQTAADLRLYKNGVEIAQNLTTTTTGSRTFASSGDTAVLFGVRQASGDGPVLTNPRRIALYAWGEGLTAGEAAQLDTRVQNLLAAIAAYSLNNVVDTLQYGTWQVWNRCLRHFASTKQRYWSASDSLYPDLWVADLDIALQSRPERVTSAELRGILIKFYAARSGTDMPLAINGSGAATYFTAGNGASPTRNQPDGMWGMVALHKLRMDKGADLTLFNAHKTVLKAAMFAIPRSGAYVWVDPVGGGWTPWGFEDAVDKRGRDLFGTVCYRRASAHLAALFASAGDTTDAAFFAAEVAAIDAAVQGDAYLWNAAGMFNAADVQNVQIDVTGSAFAVWAGVASPTQASAISNWLNTNYASVINSYGYVKQSPANWAVSHNDQAGRGVGNYDDGYWSHGHLWVCTAMAVNHPSRAVQMCEMVSAGMLTNLIPEWFGATEIGPNNLLVCCQGAYGWMRAYTAPAFNPTGIPNLKFSLWAPSLSALSDGANASPYTDPFIGSSLVATGTAPLKRTYRGVVETRYNGASKWASNVFLGSSFNTAWTRVCVVRPTTTSFAISASVQDANYYGGHGSTGFIRDNRFGSAVLGDISIVDPAGYAQVNIWSYDGTNVYHWVNSRLVSTTPLVGNLGLTGGATFGGLSGSGGFELQGGHLAEFWFDKVLSQAERNYFVEEVSARAAGYAGRDWLIWFGDSRVGHSGGSQVPVDLLRPQLTAGVDYNSIVASYYSGYTIGNHGSGTSLMDVLDDAILNRVATPNLAQVHNVILDAGINDIYTGANFDTLRVRMLALCDAISAQSKNARIVLCTIQPNAADLATVRETYRTDFNLWVKDGAWGRADSVCRLDEVPELEDPTDPTYYSDGVHQTDAGKQAKADKLKEDAFS